AQMAPRNAQRIAGLPCRFAPFHTAAIVFRVEHVRPAVLGQHPFRRRVEYFLRAGAIGYWRTAVQSHPAAGAAELILVEEVIRGEETVLAVDGRFDAGVK